MKLIKVKTITWIRVPREFYGGAAFQWPLPKNPNFFNKMHFSFLVFPLVFFSLCSQRLGIVHVVFSNVFMLLCKFQSLDHRIKFFSFLFIFFFTFPHPNFLPPFYFFPLSLLSCCLASLPHYTPSTPRLVALSPFYALCYLKLLPCHLVLLLQPATLSPCCAACYLELPHYLKLPHIALLPSQLVLPHCLIAIAP